MDERVKIAAVMVLLFIIYFIYEFLKEKHKSKTEKAQSKEQSLFFEKLGIQLSENSSINKEILKYLNISSQKYIEEITESQARIVINSILKNSNYELLKHVSKIISENHLCGNEKEVTSKIKLFINNRLHRDLLALKEFKYKEKNIGDFKINEWKDYLIEAVLNHVLKEKGEKSLTSTLQNCYDSLEYDILEKILA